MVERWYAHRAAGGLGTERWQHRAAAAAPRRRPRRRGAAGARRAVPLHAVRRPHLADPRAAKARGIRVVDVRDEVTAVFAADAVARLTGVPGVAAVTAGPGVTNTITALKNAQLAQTPVVLLGGAAPTALQGRGALQDIDQRALMAPHVKRVLQGAPRARPRARGGRGVRARALAACPGRCSSSARSTCCTTRRSIRQWYAEAAGKGNVDRASGAALVPEPPRRRACSPGSRAPCDAGRAARSYPPRAPRRRHSRARRPRWPRPSGRCS